MVETDDTPKYRKAYQMILQRLKAGRYSIGTRMPTEGELVHQFGISRVTVRRALDMLVQDGYVESRQGSGYRVITLSPASDTCLTSFTDAMLRAGHEPTTRLISIKTFPAGVSELSNLSSEMTGEPITRITRLRLADGQPRMLVKTYAAARLVPNAGPADFPEKGAEQSILRVLCGKFGLEWSAACEEISPAAADPEMAATLEIAEGSPLLRQTCSAFAEDGSVVFHEEVFRTDTVSFNMSRHGRTPRH